MTVRGKTTPFDMVIFGGTGDLAMRKLMPSLLCRDDSGVLHEDGRIVAVGRREIAHDAYVRQVKEACRKHAPVECMGPETWRKFAKRLSYIQVDSADRETYQALVEGFQERAHAARVFYLATPPNLFGGICHGLHDWGLVTPESRVVLEKPLGHDLESARQINAEVGDVFQEEQVYRIDHYLGKETVQNLLVLRFANALFEPLWSHAHIDHVQITAAESVGLEGRSSYYDSAGALRDMVQNHLLQLLCLVAMEAPVELEADSVRDEKLKVLKSLAPIGTGDLSSDTVRGQYVAGAINGSSVPGYEEENVAGKSNTETFVALRAEVKNWRWAGVPFYLRTGKRLPSRASEIVVQFRNVPHSIFPGDAGQMTPNRLVIRLQPDEGVKFLMTNKVPGPGGLRLQSVPLNLSFAETFKARNPDAYERLLVDVIRGNPTLFMRRDELDAAWSWVEPILQGWGVSLDRPKPYTAGTWGPSAAIALIERDGRTWYEEEL